MMGLWYLRDDRWIPLEKAVSNGYLAGGRFSAADLYVGSQLN